MKRRLLVTRLMIFFTFHIQTNNITTHKIKNISCQSDFSEFQLRCISSKCEFLELKQLILAQTNPIWNKPFLSGIYKKSRRKTKKLKRKYIP